MKKSNRIARKGDTAPKSAQAKQTAARKGAVPPKAPRAKHAAPPALPCHRLAPRTAAETRELRAFTANLGIHLGSCVFASGDVQHLFRSDAHFFEVTEAMAVAWSRGRSYGLGETLWHHRVSLAEYVKRRPKLKLSRTFHFEPLPKAEAAEWAEQTGVAERLALEDKRDLWGADEADGKSKGRLVLSTVRRSDGGGRERIYNRCGSFTLEDEETGETRPITREDVVFRLRNFAILPALEKAVPAGFERDFKLACRGEDAEESPTDPADVLG